MAENVRSQKWLAVTFFLVCNLIFAALIYAIVTRSADLTYKNWMGSFRSGSETGSKAATLSMGDRIVMVRDRQIDLGKVKMTYRGLTSGVVAIDLVLSELDPQYVYHRRIPVKEIKQGFKVSDQRFKALSVNRQRLQMVPIGPSN